MSKGCGSTPGARKWGKIQPPSGRWGPGAEGKKLVRAVVIGAADVKPSHCQI